jgi:hypothetical protein
MSTTHLEHVWVSPTARTRETFRERESGHQVGEDSIVGGSDISRCTEIMPWAVVLSGDGPAPVTVLDEDHMASGVDEIRPLLKIQLATAAIELDTVEAIAHKSIDIFLIAGVSVAMILTDAIVSIPSGERAEERRDEMGQEGEGERRSQTLQ